MKDIIKAEKMMRMASLDIWEAKYVCGGRRLKKDAKRTAIRARRRLDKAQARA